MNEHDEVANIVAYKMEEFIRNKFTVNKLTDAEIVKALEVHSNDKYDNCEGCPYLKNDCCEGFTAYSEPYREVLDLINRQKAEIERLNKEVDRLSLCVLYHDGQIVEALTTLREKCLEHQDFHKGEDGKFRGWISVEDLDYIISEVSG